MACRSAFAVAINPSAEVSVKVVDKIICTEKIANIDSKDCHK